jgi:hypothetical protein
MKIWKWSLAECMSKESDFEEIYTFLENAILQFLILRKIDFNYKL